MLYNLERTIRYIIFVSIKNALLIVEEEKGVTLLIQSQA